MSIGLLITALLAVLPAVPFTLQGALNMVGWLEFALKVLALALCLPLALGVAATVDSFFIKLRLRPAPLQGRTESWRHAAVPFRT